mgnify:CR=1 FL=1|jgi:ADP-ribose pyrophosphatase
MCDMDTKNARVSGDTPDTYDPDAFPHPSVTVDVVAFTSLEDRLCVLLVERGIWPFEGMWALPGGFVRMDEELEAAAHRELTEETGIAEAHYLEQLFTFGAIGRDPRTRVISVAYFALMPGPASECRPLPGTDAVAARWWPLDELPPLAFDHQEIIDTALARLRAKLGYTSVAYALLPEEFTLTELQTVYEVILGRTLDKRNFRKKMLSMGILDATPRQKRAGAHRPAQLYRFTRREPVFLD